jgi:hypothetical protein
MSNHKASCCEQGSLWVEFCAGTWSLADSAITGLKHCPFCGLELTALGALLGGPKRTFCFDVDGVLAEDAGGKEYAERLPIPEGVALLKRVKKAGHEVVIQTARYMSKCDGDPKRASEYGYSELCRWLAQHEIPFDAVYFGKASAHVYVDDRGCRFVRGKAEDALAEALQQQRPD